MGAPSDAFVEAYLRIGKVVACHFVAHQNGRSDFVRDAGGGGSDSLKEYLPNISCVALPLTENIEKGSGYHAREESSITVWTLYAYQIQ